MYICDGLVLNLPPENKPWNVVYNVFSELTQMSFFMFFRIKFSENCNRKVLRENWKLNQILYWKTSKTIIGKLQFKDNFEPKSCMKNTNFAESWNTKNRETREKPNFAESCNRKPIFVLNLSSWKYNTVYNSRLH